MAKPVVTSPMISIQAVAVPISPDAIGRCFFRRVKLIHDAVAKIVDDIYSGRHKAESQCADGHQ
jgi:hypothetical protein